MAPFLKMYTAYVNQHDAATQTINNLRGSAKEFISQCEQDPRCTNRTFDSFLILPIQRIPRYRLLLAELLKYSDFSNPVHGFKELEASLKLLEDVAKYVNESIRQQENRQKLLEIQAKFVGKVQLVEPHRMYVMDGPLIKICRRSPKLFHFFLFNDVLVYGSVIPGTNTYLYHRTITLMGKNNAFLRVVDVPDTAAFKNAFQIINSQKSFTCCAATPEEKEEWVKTVSKTTAKLRHHNQTRQSVMMGISVEQFNEEAAEDAKSASLLAPVWVPDSLQNSCTNCHESFSLFRRKHHCRLCGQVVCSSCSSQRVWIHESMSRICNSCHKTHYSTNALPAPTDIDISNLTAKIEKFENKRDESGTVITMFYIHISVGDPPIVWTIPKRYRDFEALAEKLAQAHPHDQLPRQLPGKKVFGKFDRKFLESRMQSLNQFIESLLSTLPFSISAVLKSFLDLDDINKHKLRKRATIFGDAMLHRAQSSVDETYEETLSLDSEGDEENEDAVEEKRLSAGRPRHSAHQRDSVRLVSRVSVTAATTPLSPTSTSSESRSFEEQFVDMSSAGSSPEISEKPLMAVPGNSWGARSSVRPFRNSDANILESIAEHRGADEYIALYNCEPPRNANRSSICVRQSIMDIPMMIPEEDQETVEGAVAVVQNNDKLYFSQGDVIRVVEKGSNGWWRGECNGQTGWFPYHYVTKDEATSIDETHIPVDPAAAAISNQRRSSPGIDESVERMLQANAEMYEQTKREGLRVSLTEETEAERERQIQELKKREQAVESERLSNQQNVILAMEHERERRLQEEFIQQPLVTVSASVRTSAEKPPLPTPPRQSTNLSNTKTGSPASSSSNRSSGARLSGRSDLPPPIPTSVVVQTTDSSSVAGSGHRSSSSATSSSPQPISARTSLNSPYESDRSGSYSRGNSVVEATGVSVAATKAALAQRLSQDVVSEATSAEFKSKWSERNQRRATEDSVSASTKVESESTIESSQPVRKPSKLSIPAVFASKSFVPMMPPSMRLNKSTSFSSSSSPMATPSAFDLTAEVEDERCRRLTDVVAESQRKSLANSYSKQLFDNTQLSSSLAAAIARRNHLSSTSDE
eukprot:GILK01009991.1.p1 GENE.GILK01009991.1~~GILK01009991.1.p1  ORF type:complete len:1198 (-),score=260.65 GILK01009991.1:77-3361(-)